MIEPFKDMFGDSMFDIGSPPTIRETDAHTGSDLNHELVRYWLQNCLLTHERCGQGHVSKSLPNLPSRVVDVSNLSKPYLLETRGRRGDYVTLSYCWGQGKRLLTTSQSHEIFQREIPTDDQLPSTFRDAFQATKALGYSYLWIDALCILQDDEADMHIHLATMGYIFQESAVTIFGSNGDSTDSGLFASRDRPSRKPCNVVLETIEDGSPQETEVAFFSDYYDFYVDPLSKRGWVLQEQVLAQRQLIYTPNEIRWTCRTSSVSETRPYKTRLDNHPDDAIVPSGPLNEMRLLVSQPDIYKTLSFARQDLGEIYDTFYDTLFHYSARKLSVPDDRLPAIAGIAQIMHGHFGCQYGAGLWKEDLARGLCWATEIESDDANDAIEAYKEVSYEPEKYIAPSWSWASIRDRGVRWQQKALRSGRGKTVMEVEVLDWNFTYPSDAVIPFGRVSSGTVTLRGYLRDLLLVASPWVCAHNWFFHARDPSTASVVGTVTLDSPGTRQELLRDYQGDEDLDDCRTLPEAGIPVSTLTAYVCDSSRYRHIHALVLLPSNDNQLQYRRIGLLYAEEPLETTPARRREPPRAVERGSWTLDEKQGQRQTVYID